MDVAWPAVLKTAKRSREWCRFPSKTDGRVRHGMLFPRIDPQFRIAPGDTVFTIGSCFARNIEEKLEQQSVPTLAFTAPETLGPRPNSALNEYNPGTISQRIMSALRQARMPDGSVVEHDGGFTDLLISNTAPTTWARALELRSDIDAVYSHLARSDLVVITLGLVEVWVDLELGIYLNRMPPRSVMERTGRRYCFRLLDTGQCLKLLRPALEALRDADLKVLLTISPVPLSRTFTGMDCVTANAFGKSTLRASAQELTSAFENVAYFPSYEIILSGGTQVFEEDNVHVDDGIVGLVTEYMMENFSASTTTPP